MTAEPTDSAVGRRVAELLRALGPGDGVEPETAALLSAADRAEHVAATIRPALERGEVVVCDRYVLTSIALHGGGRGADVERIRGVNTWGTGRLLPDLTLVVQRGETPDARDGLVSHDVDVEAADAALAEAVDADPDRCMLCHAESPESLPEPVLARLQRLLDTRASMLAAAPAPADPGRIPAR